MLSPQCPVLQFPVEVMWGSSLPKLLLSILSRQHERKNVWQEGSLLGMWRRSCEGLSFPLATACVSQVALKQFVCVTILFS